jgi:hypothetical protein
MSITTSVLGTWCDFMAMFSRLMLYYVDGEG